MNGGNECCETCRFWKRYFPPANLGSTVLAVQKIIGTARRDCLRHAPTANGWYTTNGSDWCGDYEPFSKHSDNQDAT